MSVADIFVVTTSGEINCDAKAEICGGRKELLARDRHLADIWSGNMSVWNI